MTVEAIKPLFLVVWRVSIWCSWGVKISGCRIMENAKKTRIHNKNKGKGTKDPLFKTSRGHRRRISVSPPRSAFLLPIVYRPIVYCPLPSSFFPSYSTHSAMASSAPTAAAEALARQAADNLKEATGLALYSEYTPPSSAILGGLTISKTATMPCTMAMMMEPMALTMAIKQDPTAWQTPSI